MTDNEVVIQIVGLINGQPTEYDGQFVVEYDPSRDGMINGMPMLCYLRTTPNVEQATRYASDQAFELWRSVDKRNPVRPDGRPNRPFTAFSISVSAPDNVMPL